MAERATTPLLPTIKMPEKHIAVDDPTIKRVRAPLAPRDEIYAHVKTPFLACAQDIVCLILQFLQDEGFTTSFLTMQDETKIKLAEKQTQRSYFKRMRKAILGAYLKN